jgi:hypothetical protein
MQVEDKFKHEYRPNNLKTIVSQLYIACRLHETHAHYTISKITGRRPCVGVSPTNPFALWLQKEPVFGEIQKSLFEHFCLPAACGNFREAMCASRKLFSLYDTWLFHRNSQDGTRHAPTARGADNQNHTSVTPG